MHIWKVFDTNPCPILIGFSNDKETEELVVINSWHEEAYEAFDTMCWAVIVSSANNTQRKAPYEVLFCQYAEDKYGKNARKRQQTPKEEQNSREVYNELDL